MQLLIEKWSEHSNFGDNLTLKNFDKFYTGGDENIVSYVFADIREHCET